MARLRQGKTSDFNKDLASLGISTVAPNKSNLLTLDHIGDNIAKQKQPNYGNKDLARGQKKNNSKPTTPLTKNNNKNNKETEEISSEPSIFNVNEVTLKPNKIPAGKTPPKARKKNTPNRTPKQSPGRVKNKKSPKATPPKIGVKEISLDNDNLRLSVEVKQLHNTLDNRNKKDKDAPPSSRSSRSGGRRKSARRNSIAATTRKFF